VICGIYTAASGMICEEERQNAIAENLVGSSHPGYKRCEPIFEPFSSALARAGGMQLGSMGVPLGGVTMAERLRCFNPGKMKRTDQPLDFYIDGDGFFAVQGPAGTLYTRNGCFRLGPSGMLTTGSGFPVLGDRGTLILPPGKVKADEKGNVSVNGTQVGRLKVVRFADLGRLRDVGHGLFEADPTMRPEEATDVKVCQGFLEMSNVKLFKEMTELITSMRSYETCQKAIALQDQSLDKVINQVGSLT